MDETFSTAMEELRQAHEAVPWESAASARELQRPAARWLEALYRAFQLAGDEDLERLVGFARATASEVSALAELFWPLVEEAEVELERLERHGDWSRYCHRRSALELAKTLYHGLGSGPGPFEVAGSGTDVLDGLARSFAETYGNLYDDEIPPYVPPSHWWWWAPDPPPSDRP